MGADRWVKSAAGLLMPNRQLAAPFRFMPCEDCCSSLETCSDCLDWTVDEIVSDAVTLVVPEGFTVLTCTHCSEAGGTYELTRSTLCGWLYEEANVCSGQFGGITFRLTAGYFIIQEACRLSATVAWDFGGLLGGHRFEYFATPPPPFTAGTTHELPLQRENARNVCANPPPTVELTLPELI